MSRFVTGIVPSLIAFAAVLHSPAKAAVHVVIDYRFDTTGFFNDPTRRQTLQLAVDSVNRWTDSLSSIVPSGNNQWTPYVISPSTGAATAISGSTVVAQDEFRLFVGARTRASNVLASADRNYVVASGTSDWINRVKYRGQTGAPSADFGPWGGSISFNDATDWFFGSTSQGLTNAKYDFLSVAIHELTHVFGIGVAESWTAQVGGGRFYGPNAMATGSPNNPNLTLDASADHWQVGTLSYVAGQLQQASAAPSFAPGERRWLTNLDAAALQDIGWQSAVAGDLDRDGDVDFDDAFELVNNYGSQTAGWAQGDFDGDGDVDFDDAFEQVNNYGGSNLSLAYSQNSLLLQDITDAGVTIPEPSVCVLGLAMLSCLGRPHRIRRA